METIINTGDDNVKHSNLALRGAQGCSSADMITQMISAKSPDLSKYAPVELAGVSSPGLNYFAPIVEHPFIQQKR
jgi:hypothetical protein